MNPSLVMLVVEPNPNGAIVERIKQYQGLGQRAFVLTENVAEGATCSYQIATFADFAQKIMPDIKWLDDYKRLRAFEKKLKDTAPTDPHSDGAWMEQPRVIGHVVSVNGFRLKVELSPEAKSSSRATPDGVQRAVAINAFLTFDLGAGTHAIGVLSDLEARESYDPTSSEELSLQLTKPRRIASIQLLGTVRQAGKNRWRFDTGITVLPTLDTPAEVANPEILACVFGQPPQRNRPASWNDKDGDFDFALEIGSNRRREHSCQGLVQRLVFAAAGHCRQYRLGKSYTVTSLLRSVMENAKVGAQVGPDPHIFILDVNGEYASAFLPKAESNYAREPNEAYVNRKKAASGIWLMNSEEICEWLSASEQTQQPVLKAWWAFLKSGSPGAQNK